MDQYKDVFEPSSINRTIFFKILTVSEYNGVDLFKTEKPQTYNIWSDNAMKRYDDNGDDTYLTKACFLPEYSNILGVAYGTINMESGEPKRTIQKIFLDGDESFVINEFFNVLKSIPQLVSNPLLCGHNITGYDIPFLIKRAMIYDIKVPSLLKKTLSTKPWESNILDTVNLWKFNGSDYTSLKLISDMVGLKYKTLPMNLDEINKKYWKDGYGDWCEYELMNQINLTMQLLKKLREL